MRRVWWNGRPTTLNVARPWCSISRAGRSRIIGAANESCSRRCRSCTSPDEALKIGVIIGGDALVDVLRERFAAAEPAGEDPAERDALFGRPSFGIPQAGSEHG